VDRVSDLYNRGGFTKGYYVQYHGTSMMSMERPNHTGVKVGEAVLELYHQRAETKIF